MNEPIAPRLLDILTSPWAIMEDKLREIQAVYFTHLRGEKVDLSSFEAKAKAKAPQDEDKPYVVMNGVAIIPVDGVIAKKMNLFTKFSGGVSTQILARDIKSALADPDVTSILLDIDSPGGTVDGTEEIANLIYEARQRKPVVSYTDGLMASAAYWIGAAADRIYISGETPMVGSIGVVTAHVDYSKFEEKIGVKTTEIYAGKYKRIASEYSPLSQEGRSYLQAQVDYLYSIFADKVASYRPNTLSIPESGPISWAEGQIFTGNQAIVAGLADGVSPKALLMEQMGDNPVAWIRRERVAQNIRQINQQRRNGA